MISRKNAFNFHLYFLSIFSFAKILKSFKLSKKDLGLLSTPPKFKKIIYINHGKYAIFIQKQIFTLFFVKKEIFFAIIMQKVIMIYVA